MDMLTFVGTDMFRMDCLIDTVFINVVVTLVPINETPQAMRANLMQQLFATKHYYSGGYFPFVLKPVIFFPFVLKLLYSSLLCLNRYIL